jgi:lipoprotein-releasing system permease protein
MASTPSTDTGDLGLARPFARVEWMIAGRYLRSRRREAFISVIAGFSFAGIMLGVATLIIVMAVMNGFRTELLSKILGVYGHLTVGPIDGPLTDYEAVAKRIEGVEGVTFAMPFIDGQALASGPSGALGAQVRGLSRVDIERMPLVAGNVRMGSLTDFDSGKGLAIGLRLARNLGVAVGDPVTIVTPRGNVTPLGVVPRVKAYPVAAIFEVGMTEYDSSLIFMPLAQAQLYFNSDGRVSAIDVFADDPDAVGRMRRPIEDAAGRPTIVTDWRQRHQTLFSALEVERNVMFLILTMIVLVAALNIVSGMTMLVKDKGRDIAVLRSMGATRGAVLRIFFITGASIGTVGTLAGFLLGLAVCLNIEQIRRFISWLTSTDLFSPELYFLSQLPADIDTGDTVSVVLIALALSLAATAYPAWRAGRLDPVEALRYE